MRWRNVVGYERVYAVSEHGDIKSITGGPGRVNGRKMKPWLHLHGNYMMATLSKNGKTKAFLVHRLVAEAFIGPCPDSKEVNHIDGVKTHNHYTNLEYVTHRQNIIHAIENGLFPLDNLLRNRNGENNGRAKLTDKNVKWIKRQFEKSNYKFGKRNAINIKIAKKFKVSVGTVEQLSYGQTWKHLQ